MNRRLLKHVVDISGWTYGVAVLGFLFLPAVVILPASLSGTEMLEFPPRNLTFKWYQSVFDNSAWMNSAWLSVRLSALTALVAVAIGLLVALAQYRIGEIAPRIKTVMMVPIMVPHIIIGTGMFSILLNLQFGLGSIWPLVVVNSAVALPLVLSVLLPTFSTVDPLLWTAANTLGARPYQIIVKILFPVTSVAMVVAIILAFHSAWDETTFAVFIGPTVIPPITSRLYSYLQQNVTPEVAVVTTLLLAVTLAGALIVFLINSLRNSRKGLSYAKD
ncbi:ABC transporter permease [Agrobacterium fabrum]|uniref:ABC transporter permease n=1 Tax=Agrobacterium fabrum TaxID=1176649 RepID=UPI00157348DC|nr:ABC transporter permease subunit [Agrobacterium fabrum]WCK80081.1 ABC transporter permease subunit [Agrobacterium fabrum]